MALRTTQKEPELQLNFFFFFALHFQKPNPVYSSPSWLVNFSLLSTPVATFLSVHHQLRARLLYQPSSFVSEFNSLHTSARMIFIKCKSDLGIPFLNAFSDFLYESFLIDYIIFISFFFLKNRTTIVFRVAP